MSSDIKINQQQIEETISSNQSKLETKMEQINQQIVALGNQISKTNQKVQENKTQIRKIDERILFLLDDANID